MKAFNQIERGVSSPSSVVIISKRLKKFQQIILIKKKYKHKLISGNCRDRTKLNIFNGKTNKNVRKPDVNPLT